VFKQGFSPKPEYVCDLWCLKQHWDRRFSSYLVLPCPYQSNTSPYTFIYHRRSTDSYRHWPTRLHGVITQKTKTWIFTAVQTLSAIRYYKRTERHCLLYFALWYWKIITAGMYSCSYTECPHTVYSLHWPHRYIVPAVNKNPAVRVDPQNWQQPSHLDWQQLLQSKLSALLWRHAACTVSELPVRGDGVSWGCDKLVAVQRYCNMIGGVERWWRVEKIQRWACCSEPLCARWMLHDAVQHWTWVCTVTSCSLTV
jgi:hypothetical protein